MKKINPRIISLIIFLVILSVTGITYAFFSANLIENNKTETFVKTNVLGLEYKGITEIDVAQVIPGTTYEKTFSVKNTSNREITYNIYYDNILNEFECGFNYSLTLDETNLFNNYKLPATNDREYIAYEVRIPANTTQNFKLNIEYENGDYNQNADQNAVFTATLGIDANKIEKEELASDVLAYIPKERTTNESCPTNSDISLDTSNPTDENDDTTTTDDVLVSVIPICQNECIDTTEKKVTNPTQKSSVSEDELIRELKISHDIYYSDETLYSTGKNKRYTTYCSEYENNGNKYVKYCSKINGQGICKKVTTTSSCGYNEASKDLGRTSFEYQTLREYFADAGNGNWHIQTFCSSGKLATTDTYDKGYYYCSRNQNLHDWYDMGEVVNEQVWSFDYTGGEQTFEVPLSGNYKIETWGAQGGSQTGVVEGNGWYVNMDGGYGGYSTGEIYFEAGEKIYLNVGGQGQDITARNYGGKGGYNGGGSGGTPYGYSYVGSGGGGGATHVALVPGVLSTLENSKNKILIVAGAGGGASWVSNPGSAGGYVGSKNSSNIYNSIFIDGGNQEKGYAFGQGQNGKNGFYGNGDCEGTGGGGGGYYGGYAYQHNNSGTSMTISGAGGSSYIGNSLLKNKHMTCYNCTTSEEENIKTFSNTCTSSEPIEDCSKIGNGYVKIIYLGK